MVQEKIKVNPNKNIDGLTFVLAMWLLSRLVIVVAIQFIAPLRDAAPVNYQFPLLGFVPNFVPKMGWELFSHWDGAWYGQIATLGYSYNNDGQQYSIAFFPLYPLVSRVFMMFGLPFEVAGTLVNNLSFLGAMLLLYDWAKERYGISVARWTTAVLAWFPYSLFGTVTYTEGLFLLLTTAALRAFDKQKYLQSGLWGAMATATRPTGIALFPTFLFLAWKEKRSLLAYFAGMATSGGLLLFSLYCMIRFGDPLAFVHVQQAWQQQNLLDIIQGALALNRDSLMKLLMLLGGGYLLWYLRAKLNHVVVAYGFFSLFLLAISKAFTSLDRYIYGIVSLSLALGMVFANHPRWGYGIIAFLAIWLVRFAILFAWWQFVA